MKVHSYQIALSALSPRISVTILAPWTGGLEYIGRTMILIWERVRAASSLLPVTSEKAPARSPAQKLQINICCSTLIEPQYKSGMSFFPPSNEEKKGKKQQDYYKVSTTSSG